jgi:dihydrofolate reductase
MRRITGSAFLSLDGVMQAPGAPGEDWTGGFEYGGWLPPYTDDAVGEAVGNLLSGSYDLLLGRKTYEIFAAYWPYYDEAGENGGIAAPFNRAAKYVLTRNADQPLDWANSHRLADIGALSSLKQTDGPDLIIQGSSTIYPALLEAGLLDRLITLTFPILLGKGKRLFGAETSARALRMIDHRVSPRGVVIAHYEPAGPVETGCFAGPEQSEREKARQDRMRREG